MENRPDIEGSLLVTNVFGYWPGFHDAEVRKLELKVTDDFVVGPDLIVSSPFFGVITVPSPPAALPPAKLASFAFKSVSTAA